MSTVAAPALETVADLLEQLHVPPERILLSPPPGEATEEDLLKAPRVCELVDGVLVEKAMGFYESYLAAILIERLLRFVKRNDFGIVLGEGGLMRVDFGQVRVPDVAFYSWEHFPNKVLPQGQILDLVPDLAVEILSPSNTKKEMERKRGEYFAGGAKLVWEVYPEKKVVKVYTGPKQVKTIDENGTLLGGSVLPGFKLPVKRWFEEAGKRAG
jgi:Uma2 family endonuclease